MKRTLLLFLLLSFRFAYAQNNCSNPILVEICPSTTLTNQTNAGMGNDFPGSCNITGEDLCYKVHCPLSTKRVFVSILNATGTMRVSLQSTCGSSSCQSRSISAGTSHLSFTVSSYAYYYIWVDASATRTFDISFGGDTASTFISIPNTQGTWAFDPACTAQPFSTVKPHFDVKYNGVIQTDPMTLSPLNQPGIYCVTGYYKNTSGVEGVKTFDFEFNTIGFTAISPVQVTIPGFYNTGNWQVTSSTSHKWQYKFYDSASTGKGDFTGTPNTCLAYTFCFQFTPLSNNPLYTNIVVKATSDGWGVGFSGIIPLGCCPSQNSGCLGTTGGSPSSSAHTLAFSMDDPAGLPVELLYFRAESIEKEVALFWSTATETNNDYFTLQKSRDNFNWEYFKRVEGNGNSSVPISYTCMDPNPYTGISYYRLLQTDFDGTTAVAGICAVQSGKPKELRLYPNPAKDYLFVETDKVMEYRLVSPTGMAFNIPAIPEEKGSKLDVRSLAPGIYILEAFDNEGVQERSFIAIRHD